MKERFLTRMSTRLFGVTTEPLNCSESSHGSSIFIATMSLLDTNMETSTMPSTTPIFNPTPINLTTVSGPQGELKLISILSFRYMNFHRWGSIANLCLSIPFTQGKTELTCKQIITLVHRNTRYGVALIATIIWKICKWELFFHFSCFIQSTAIFRAILLELQCNHHRELFATSEWCNTNFCQQKQHMVRHYRTSRSSNSWNRREYESHACSIWRR